jgi:hypothetical protein
LLFLRVAVVFLLPLSLPHVCMYLGTPGNGPDPPPFLPWFGVSSGTPYPHVMQV